MGMLSTYRRLYLTFYALENGRMLAKFDTVEPAGSGAMVAMFSRGKLGPTAASVVPASGSPTGTAVARYANTNTGALTIGLALATTATQSATIALPAGWYFAVRTTSGTVSIPSAFDQAVG